jgi:hypothetical protein
MSIVNLNITEVKGFVNHIISNNRYLQAKGMTPTAIEIVGESGIGKTSSVIQIAKENNLDFVKLNLAQIEELGDLIGFPKEEYQIYKTITTDDKAHLNFTTAQIGKKIAKWVDKATLEFYLKLGFKATGASRMGYSAPEWIANKKKGGILLLDDWNRADTRFIQAIMELVDRQTYISWKLPQDWHIILTANPDNGEYMVNSIDSAQKTRYITANLEFDKDIWAVWAEEVGIDSRCINFLLMHDELVTKEVNARSITTFFNSISSFESFDKNLGMVQMLGEGSVGEEFASMFTIFINNKLDKLVTPMDMLLKDDTVLNRVKSCVGTGDSYRADIGAIMAIRLANYSVVYSKDNRIDSKIIDRLEELIVGDYFPVDLKFRIVSIIISGNRNKFSKLLMKPEIVKWTIAK